VDRVQKKAGSAFIVFGWSEGADKAALVAALTNDLVKKGLKAGEVVKQIAPIVGGGGGGKPDIAQAGGKEPTKLPDALRAADKLARELLSK
jgi:alanyl-tRNA synthetase